MKKLSLLLTAFLLLNFVVKSQAQTDNLIAYDYYLKGHELYWKYFLWFQADNKINDVEEAITYFEKALELDNEFALAYAELSLSHGTLIGITKEESHSNQARINADKALLYDPQLEMGLIAKANSCHREGNYELEAEYLKKAVRVNPNSYVALGRLALVYWNDLPDTELFLEYSLKTLRLNVQASERISKSAEFYYLSRAFREAGFLSEADYYINKMLLENPDNIGAILEKAKALVDKDGNYQQSKEFLFEWYKKDTTNIGIIRELAKICYWMRDYAEAAKYYKKMIDLNKIKNYIGNEADDARIGIVLSKLGKEKESEEYFRRYRNFAETNRNIYKYRDLVAVYALEGNSESAIEQMRIFSEQNNYVIDMIRLFKEEPLYDNIRALPEFQQILSEIETKFWKNHKRIKASLEEKGLL